VLRVFNITICAIGVLILFAWLFLMFSPSFRFWTIGGLPLLFLGAATMVFGLSVNLVSWLITKFGLQKTGAEG
jgi:hypothetical protein